MMFPESASADGLVEMTEYGRASAWSSSNWTTQPPGPRASTPINLISKHNVATDKVP